MTANLTEPFQPVLPDMPLLREELLAEIEQAAQGGASATELADLRRHYDQIAAQGRR
ncbi:MAG: hypothetical protein QM619_08780 [Micropruina sp.]|uniref:hypothetical protein n=1 Tax=Micropruina sp. TaxID=2737536 RepID=UPI0039E37FC7